MLQNMMKNRGAKRALSLFLVLTMLVSMLPTLSLSLAAASSADRVADPSTAGNYTSMLGTDADGNRYSGRVWTDKSVYTDASVNLDGHTVANNGDFMVVYSALGSSTSVTTSTTSAANLDVVFVLDNSTSMAQTIVWYAWLMPLTSCWPVWWVQITALRWLPLTLLPKRWFRWQPILT